MNSCRPLASIFVDAALQGHRLGDRDRLPADRQLAAFGLGEDAHIRRRVAQRTVGKRGIVARRVVSRRRSRRRDAEHGQHDPPRQRMPPIRRTPLSPRAPIAASPPASLGRFRAGGWASSNSDPRGPFDLRAVLAGDRRRHVQRLRAQAPFRLGRQVRREGGMRARREHQVERADRRVGQRSERAGGDALADVRLPFQLQRDPSPWSTITSAGNAAHTVRDEVGGPAERMREQRRARPSRSPRPRRWDTPRGRLRTRAPAQAFCSVVSREGSCLGRSTLTFPMFAWPGPETTFTCR